MSQPHIFRQLREWFGNKLKVMKKVRYETLGIFSLKLFKDENLDTFLGRRRNLKVFALGKDL